MNEVLQPSQQSDLQSSFVASPTQQTIEAAQPVVPTPPKKSSKTLLLILFFVLLAILLGGGGYYLGMMQTQTTTVVSSPTPVVQASPQPSAFDDVWTVNQQTYIDPVYNFTITYPLGYSVSGELAHSLEDWQAAKGITISDTSNPATPKIFIEAVFDGYGPIFSTGAINAKFVNHKLVIESIDKKDDATYTNMVNDGLILPNHELFLSKIIEYNGVPFWFQISHQNRGDVQLEEALTKILSTFEFTSISSTNEWQTYEVKKLPHLSFPSFRISYPATWSLQDSSITEYNLIEISKGNYLLKLGQSPTGGSGCIFSDYEMTDGPVADLRDVQFTQIETPVGSMRYFTRDNHLYTFCIKNNSGFYSNPGIPAEISFEAPSNPDVSTMKEMESILQTIQIVN